MQDCGARCFVSEYNAAMSTARLTNSSIVELFVDLYQFDRSAQLCRPGQNTQTAFNVLQNIQDIPSRDAVLENDIFILRV